MIRNYIFRLTALALVVLGATGCAEFQAFDWTPLDRLPQFPPTASKLEVVELQPAAPDDTYAPIPRRGQQYRWTKEGTVREGIRLVVYESPQRGWQVRDGFWSMRTLKVLLGAPESQLTHIAVVGSYTLFMTNLGQLMAFDHRSEYFCRRAISTGSNPRLIFRRAASTESLESTMLIVGNDASSLQYQLDLRWLCGQAAPET